MQTETQTWCLQRTRAARGENGKNDESSTALYAADLLQVYFLFSVRTLAMFASTCSSVSSSLSD